MRLFLLSLVCGLLLACSPAVKSKHRIYDVNNHYLPKYDVVEYQDGKIRVYDINNHYLPLYDIEKIDCMGCDREKK